MYYKYNVLRESTSFSLKKMLNFLQQYIFFLFRSQKRFLDKVLRFFILLY